MPEDSYMTKKAELSCSLCSAAWQKSGKTFCWSSDPDNRPATPAYCPSHENADILESTEELYGGDSDDAKIARAASRIEGLCYQPIPGSEAVRARWTRVEETIAFAKLMGYKKIGIATCIGLLEETHRLAEILTAQEFVSLSVCCKTGSIDKLEIGLQESDKVRPLTYEPACNPVAQAKLLNRCKTDLNVIVGLCIGHDMLFTKYSDAPVTTLVVKDRVTGHNPVCVLYGQNFYYKRLQKEPVSTER